MLLTILLLPCLFKAVSSGTSPNPRVVIVASDVHYWTKFSETEVASDNILQKISDKNYCTCRWVIPLRVWRSFVTPIFLGSCLTDTLYRSVRNSQFFYRLADSERIRLSVLNVFFVRELTKRLPENSPVIVTAVNPGYCKSELRRNFPFALRIIDTIREFLLARTTEEGSRQLVWAAIGGAGRELELRGGFVDKANLEEVSDYVLSDEGVVVQTRLWVCEFSHICICN
jgi:retinol dehydrogenase 12